MDLIETTNEKDEAQEIHIDSEHQAITPLSSHSDTTTATATPTTDNTIATVRTQPFSFASAYTSSVFSPLQQNTNSEAVAFTVLHNDDFYTVGGKPNAIVRPLPRNEHATLSDSREQQQQEHTDDTLASSKTASLSSVAQPELVQSQQEQLHFNEQLNRKLRYLRHAAPKDTKFRHTNKNENNNELLNKRPLFITTVPTGVFLPAQKLPVQTNGKRHVYAFSSHPFVVNDAKYKSYNANYNNNNNNNYHSVKKNSSNSSKDKMSMVTKSIEWHDKPNMTTTRINGMRLAQITKIPMPTATAQLTEEGPGPTVKKQETRETRNKREKPEPYMNMMYDRRIVRGSNFAAPPHPLLEEVNPFDRAAELRRRRYLSLKCRNKRNTLGTPPAVTGRKHEVVQTEKYLEELLLPQSNTVDTQTDLFLERPPTPPYIPAKVGIDVGTEIGDGELFHFDAEAQPIIDVLVDACVEQSILEVAHEQELLILRKKQEDFLAQREAELAELRRLEAEEMRLQSEKDRRLRQDIIAKELDREMQKGITAAKLLQGHIAGLLPEILDSMEPATDNAKKEQLMRTVCPWLSTEVAEEVGNIVDSREILTVIIKEIIKQRAEIYAGYKEEVPMEPTEPSICEEEMEAQCQECCPCESESVECSSIESNPTPTNKTN